MGVEERREGGSGGVNGSNLASLQASNHGHPTPPLTPQHQEVLLRISHLTLMTEQKDGNFYRDEILPCFSFLPPLSVPQLSICLLYSLSDEETHVAHNGKFTHRKNGTQILKEINKKKYD